MGQKGNIRRATPGRCNTLQGWSGMITSRTWHAFTLVEILVVIALTSIMAAILYPIIGKARENSRQSICMSNQKQLAQAMQQYVQDNNNTFPGVVGFVDEGSSWHNAVRAEHYSNAIFACPNTMADGSLVHPTYGLNGYLYGANTIGLTDPAHTLLSADANTSIILSAGPKPGVIHPGKEIDLTRYHIDRTRHSGNYVAAFMDGHTEALYPEQYDMIYSAGEEGSYLVFGATSISIGFANDTTAVGTSKSVEEGTTVRLINQADEAVTPQVTLSGAASQPRQGLLPGISDLHLSTGKSKVFFLYCCLEPMTYQKVDTIYDFGDAQHQVEITVRRPTTPALPPGNNVPIDLTHPPAPPTTPIYPQSAGR